MLVNRGADAPRVEDAAWQCAIPEVRAALLNKPMELVVGLHPFGDVGRASSCGFGHFRWELHTTPARYQASFRAAP